MAAKQSSLDTLYSQVAKKILSESLGVKKGESITIETWNNGLPFARQVVLESRKIGCIPILLFEDEEAYVSGVKNSPPDLVGKMGKHEYGLLASTDAYVFIPGPPIGTYSSALPQELKTKSTSYNSSWYEAAEKARLRGARLTFGYVGQDFAKLLGKPVSEIVKHQLKAALVDFKEIGRKEREVAEHFQDGSPATIETAGEKVELQFKGDLEIEDGVIDEQDVAGGSNMAYVPPGMISKDVESVNGTVKISSSVSRLGLVEDATLEFKDGKLVSYESKSALTRKKLKSLVEAVPEDSGKLSRLALGFNPVLKYGYGQDRLVSGSVTLAGFGLNAILRNCNLNVSNNPIVIKGKL